MAVGTKVDVGIASNVSMGSSVGVKIAPTGVLGTGVVGGVIMVWFGKLHADVKTMMKIIQRGFIHSSFAGEILKRAFACHNTSSDASLNPWFTIMAKSERIL